MIAEKQTSYFPLLDAFRGIAIIFILLFHSRLEAFKTLWIGVPMFFVLSGFLITRSLLAAKGTPHYLKNFYLRRILRIFPAYYLVLILSAAWGLLVHASFTYFPAFIFYLQSYVISHDIKPEYCNGLINHTWSLSVEELFYVFWPLIILYLPKRLLIPGIWLTGLFSLAYKLILLVFYYTAGTDQLILLSLPGNLDGLMAGALLAALSWHDQRFFSSRFPFNQLVIVCALCVALSAGNFLDYEHAVHFSLFKEGLSVLAVVLSFYVIRLACSASLSFPGSNFLQRTGKISYGLYLYHALVFGITDACIYHYKLSIPLLLSFPFKLAVSVGLALLSWNYAERYFLSLKQRLHS